MPDQNVDFVTEGFIIVFVLLENHIRNTIISPSQREEIIFNLTLRVPPKLLQQLDPTQCDPRLVDIAKGKDSRPTALGASCSPFKRTKKKKQHTVW